MDSIEVSIGIAVYNVADYVERCIKSVLEQDFDNFEIVVVDDCCTDESIKIVREIASHHPNGSRLRIVRHAQNQGAGAVRNTCINEAKGRFLFFLDGDDFIAPNTISLLYKEMIKTNADIVIGNHHQVDISGEVVDRTHFKQGIIEDDFAIGRWLKENKTDYYPVALWNKLFKTSFLRDNNLFCIDWHRQEDVFFTVQMSLVVKKICTIGDYTLSWVLRPGSTINQEATPFLLKQYLDLYDRSVNAFDEYKTRNARELPKEVYYLLTRRFLGGFCMTKTMRSKLLTEKEKRDFVNHIKSITNLGIRIGDLYSIKQKFIFLILMLPNRFFLIDTIIKIAVMLKKIRRE